ncbi:hypothetical protein HZH68_005538 [Vespula germanica]|uniref:Uncharacterized protein n=1 Tax=Vespula germanica TaxID=30212 RepID=A0A834KJW1_VESGE|nr:hypothetical protein HZH68_005538 [Vespula germanica]
MAISTSRSKRIQFGLRIRNGRESSDLPESAELKERSQTWQVDNEANGMYPIDDEKARIIPVGMPRIKAEGSSLPLLRKLTWSWRNTKRGVWTSGGDGAGR